MATTVAAVFIHGAVMSVAHVGDSRVYLIRDRRIYALTVDHAPLPDTVRRFSEDEAESRLPRSAVTRAIGAEPSVAPDLSEFPVMQHDIVLLCTDGLTRCIRPEEILQAVQSHDDLQGVADRLVDMANAAGGHDNVTVVLVLLNDRPHRTVLQRLYDRFLSGVSLKEEVYGRDRQSAASTCRHLS